MRAKEMRANTRIPVNRRGTLNAGGAWFPCLLLDMSESGILLLSNRTFAVGQRLDFRCELFPDKVLECKLEVRHGGEGALGFRIVEIDKNGKKLCQLFLQEQYLDTNRLEHKKLEAKEMRANTRVPVDRRGTLNAGGAWFPCLLLDMSESGILLLSNRALAVGQRLDFRCELFPDKVLECKLEVRHGGEDGLGFKIVKIDENGKKLCQLFLQELYFDTLNKRN